MSAPSCRRVAQLSRITIPNRRVRDDTSTRVFEVRKSAAVDIALTFVVGVASTAAWDAIKFLVGKLKGDGRMMEITYADLTPDGGRRQWTVKGEGHDVIEAIDRLRQTPEP